MMSSMDAMSTSRERLASVPDWENMFSRFKEAVCSGNDTICVKAVSKLAQVTNQAPEDVVSRAIPVLCNLLSTGTIGSSDSGQAVQEAVAYCLKRIASRGEGGSLALKIGQFGVPAALVRLFLYTDSSSLKRGLIKCLWSLVTFSYPNRIAVARVGGLEIVIRELNSCEDYDAKRYLLEILSALTTIRESRRIIICVGGLKFLVEAARVGSLVSRERACQAIGLIGVTRRARRMLVEAGVIPVLVDLFRVGDSTTKLVAANSLGVVSAHIEYIRPVAEAGAIPLYAELLSGPDPVGKEIAEDVFCILAVAESNAVAIAEHLVRILREGDYEAKAAASDVLWDLAGYRHSVSVVRNSGAIPLLVELLRHGSVEFRERVSGAVSQLSYNERDRESLADAGVIPVLIEWLGDESEELRDNAAEALVNFSEDQEHCDRVRVAIDHPAFRSMQSRLVRIRASDELMVRSMRRMTIGHLTHDPDLV